jgi:hypothetical protein
MRTLLFMTATILCITIQTGCQSSTPPANTTQTQPATSQPAGRTAPKSMLMLEPGGPDSSPIIITDGSVHVRQKDGGVTQLDLNHGVINFKNHRAVDVKSGPCPVPTSTGNCVFGVAQPLTAPWTIQLKDSGGNIVGTLSAPDQTGLILFSAADSTHTLALEDDNPSGSNPGDGEGFVECGASSSCTASLASAVITLNSGTSANTPLPCTNPGTQKCTLKLRYCTPMATSCN